MAKCWSGIWMLALVVALAACGDDSTADDGAAAPEERGHADAGDSMDSAGEADGDGPMVRVDPDSCDFSGHWAVHRVSFASVDSPLVAGVQKSSRWYYMQAAQEGDEVTLTRGVWCGDWTTGDATVRYSDETYEALQPLASTDGRRGSYTRTDDGCMLALERIYWVYGVASVESYLQDVVAPPGRIDGDPGLEELPALPTEDAPEVADVDGDGNPGARSIIVDTPVGSGVRHALQRGWEEIVGETPRGASELSVSARFDFEEVAIAAEPAAFQTNAFVREGAPHAVRFMRVAEDFLGEGDLETCEAVRELFPHRDEPREAY